MFELKVVRVFTANHSLLIAGQRETSHRHEWRVTAEVAGEELDESGILCDFHDLQGCLDSIIEPFQSGDLNSIAPFDDQNPTAENVARHIAATLAALIPSSVRVSRVSVTEAPGCEATYRPAEH